MRTPRSIGLPLGCAFLGGGCDAVGAEITALVIDHAARLEHVYRSTR
jgi:hypothetical protein